MSEQKYYSYTDLGEKMHAKVFETMQQTWSQLYHWHAPSQCPSANKKCPTCVHCINLEGVVTKECAMKRKEVYQGIGCEKYAACRCDLCKDVMEDYEHLSAEDKLLCELWPKAFFEVLRDEGLTIIPESDFREMKP